MQSRLLSVGTRPQASELRHTALILEGQLREQRLNSLFVSTQLHNQLPLDPKPRANVSCRVRSDGVHYPPTHSLFLPPRSNSDPDRTRGAESRVDGPETERALPEIVAAFPIDQSRAPRSSYRRDSRSKSNSATTACVVR